MIGNILGERMQECRKELGISRAEMAKTLNYVTTTIWAYETGRMEPSCDTLVSIAKKLNTTTDFLLGLTDEKGR